MSETFRTDLDFDVLFTGVQIAASPSGSTRYLLECEDEIVVAYGYEVEQVTVEVTVHEREG
jgi:hypothetical protein